MKKCFLLPLFTVIFFFGKGQSIAINTSEFDVSKPYAQGALISLPISLSTNSCFDSSNAFNLYLCDASGNVLSTLPGSFNNFFTTFVNGIIPSSTIPGIYKIKVQSTSPVVSALSPSFSIALALPNFIAKANPIIASRILSDQLYFGWCSTQSIGPSSTLVLQNQSSSGASVTFQLKEGSTGPITYPTLSGSTISIVLKQTYYTLTVKADSSGIISTKSYFLINTPNNIALSNNGQQKPCLPDSVYFQIPVTSATLGGIGDNFPGMRYRVDWNDGSTTFYKQCDLVNVNGIISHFYVASSCDKGGSYYVTPKLIYPYFANNPTPPVCDGDVGGVSTQAFVYSKPFAKFQRPLKACVSTAVSFKNTSDPGSGKSGTANSCNYAANYFWYVNDSLVYQSAAPETIPKDLVYTFNTTGTYKIQLVLDNSSCALSDSIRYICIEPKPMPLFTMNGFTSFTGCVPASPTIANTTLASNCGAPIYNWSVLDSLGNPTVSTSNYTISNISAAQPTITITKPGKYQIQLCASNSCGIFCKNEDVTVAGTPTVTLPADTAYCGKGQTVNFGTNSSHKPIYNNQFGNPLTYTWTVTGVNGVDYSSSTLATQFPVITFNNFGTYTVSVTYTTNCGASQTKSQQIIFKEIPAFTAAAFDQQVCGGKSTTAVNFTSIPAGAAFTWTNSNASIGMPISGSGNISSYTTTKPTTQQVATIIITPNLNGCVGIKDTFIITVNPTPLTPTANTSIPLCQNALASPLTANASIGNTLQWYTVTTGGTASTTAPTPSTTATGTTNYFVSQINTASGCESDRLTITVNVSASTTIDTLSTSNPTVCQSANGTIVLKGLLPNTGYTLNYNKNGIAFGSININSNGTGNYTITGLTLGTYDSIRVGANNCASNKLGPIVLTDPNPPATPVATGSSPICSGTTLSLQASSTTPGVTYSWSGPNFTSSTQNPSIPNATVAMSGTYMVTATLNGCTSSNGLINIVVNQTPTAPVATDSIAYCQFATATQLTASSTTGNSLQWYSVPTNGTASTSAPTPITTINGVTSNFVSQKNTATNCESNRTPIVVTVSQNTTIDTLSTSNPTACQGVNGSIVLKGLTAGRTYKLDYKKNGVVVVSTNFSATGNTFTISGLSAGNYSNIIINFNGCQSNTFGPVVLSDPNAPIKPKATYNGAICSDSTLILNATSTTTGVSFNWTGPNGFIAINTASPTRPNANVAMSGNYIVTASLNGCTSISDTVVVVVNKTPVAPTVGSNSPVCEGNTINLTAATTTTGTISYTWSGPNSFTSNVQNPSVTNATAAKSGFYKVFVTNNNGNCVSKSDSVSVLVNGALINTITGTPQTICQGQSVVITGQTPVGGSGTYTYQWQQSTDSITWVNITGAISQSLSFSPTNTVYVRRVVASSTCTAPSNAALITVQPVVTNNIVAKDSAICIGSAAPTLVGSVPTGGSGNYTYQWESSVNGGAVWQPITGTNTVNYNPPTPTATIQYRRRVNSNTCAGLQSNASNAVTITLNAHAKAQFTYTKDVACAIFDIAANVQNITDTANGSYLWYANNQLIGSGVNMPAYSISNAFDSAVIKLVAISKFGCKNDSLQHKFYTSPSPKPSFTISDTAGCGPLKVSFTNTTAFSNLLTYSWNFGNGVTSTATNPGSTIYQTNPTRFDSIYTITLSALSTCENVTTTKTVRVASKPQALFTPTKTVGCSPLTITLTNTSRGSNMNFVWNYGDGSPIFTTTSNNAVQHTYNTGKQDTFKVRLIATNPCGSDTLMYNIVVSPNTIKLDIAVNGSDAVSCLPSKVRFINNTSGATSFSWDFGDGNLLTTTKNIDTVTHTYVTAGTYLAKVTASNGCSDTTTFEPIKVFAKPITKFTASPLTACLGDSIRFTNQTDTATGYSWRFDDGNFSSLTNVVYAYKTTGSFKATLVATRQYSGIACIDSASTNITIVSKLSGSFKVSDSVSTCVPFNVVFTNLSVPSALTTWDYGDGIKDTGDLVQHNYTNSGIFTTKMTAVSTGGCTYESTKNITVKGPGGSWVYDKGFICANTSVKFQVNAVNTDSLRFNFGDGTFLTTTNSIVNHTYAQSGNYLPSVQLLAGTSCFVTLRGVDTIKIDLIDAGFRISQQKICGSTTIAFNDTSRAFFGVQSWQWNFGDGSTLGTIKNPQHIYNTANTYAIQLIVVGNSGCTDTATLQLPITINATPTASIQAVATACANKRINYTSNITSSDSVLLQSWRFFNGTNVLGATASFVYTTSGTYTTRFVVGTVNGCYDTAFNTITINPSPMVMVSNDVTICKGQSTQLLATGSSNFTWSPPNDLSCTTCANPSAFPSVTTQYVARSTNSFGCTSTDTVLVTVAQPFTIAVIPNDSICIGQSTQLGASGAFSYSWLPSTGLSNPSIQNPIASPVITTTYQVIGTDQNNCFTSTASVTVGVGDYPVLRLGQDQVLAAGSTFTFNPTFTNGPIRNWLWKPATDLSCADCAKPMVTAKKDICYTATATNIYGCAGTDTVCIKVFCQSTQVFIPNAFLPGSGTGVNDVLMVRGTGIKLVKSFRIYNRWGQVVFERANFPPNDRQYGWSGLIQGKPANSDVYIYTCEVVCENDVPFVYKGNVAILR